jgi:hypothetical protein
VQLPLVVMLRSYHAWLYVALYCLRVELKKLQGHITYLFYFIQVNFATENCFQKQIKT